jgi:hypothetical protein
VKQREDPFDLQALRVDPNDGELLRLAKVPAKVQKRAAISSRCHGSGLRNWATRTARPTASRSICSTCIGRTVRISRSNCQMLVYGMLAFRDNLNGGCWPTWNA